MPGALYTDTCPCVAEKNVKRFDIAAVQANIVYNDYGWHDPQGRFFVLKEDIEKEGTLDDYLAKVECGDIRPEPLVLRANAGDCIEVRLTNFLPERIKASAFQLETITDIVGYHIHLVKFDTIVSDGAANGWNNISGAQPDDPFTRVIPVQGAVSVGNVFNIEPERTKCPGDYLYRSGSLRWDVESGMWGIYRVVSRGIRYHCETACRSVKQWWEKKWCEK